MARNAVKAVSADAANSRQFCDVKEATEITKTSEATIRRKLTSGELHRYKFGSRTLIKTDELLSLVKEA
jgi:excisionase family DNA binding protein